MSADSRAFAAQHAASLAAPIERLCGKVIAKGMTGILEHCCKLQAERDQFLHLLYGAEFALNTPENNREFGEDEFVPVAALSLREIRAAIAKATGGAT